MPCQSISANFTFTYAGGGASPLGADATNRIISMNSTIGLGSESSTLNFTVAGPPGANKWGLAAEASVGQPVNFTCNNFKFGGLLKSIKTTEDSNGIVANVNLTCAKELLGKYDVLINKTACPFGKVRRSSGGGVKIRIGPMLNAKNVHAILEGASIDQTACGGENAGSILPVARGCGSYGRANEGKVRKGSTTYAAILRAMGTPFLGTWGGTGVRVNLGPIRGIAASIPYASTSAYKMTLLDLINAVCDEAGYDFHCSMNGNSVIINLVNKRVQSTFGTIKNYIETAKQDKKCISSSVGAESKNEKTQRMVFGGPINYVKEIYVPSGGTVGVVLGFNGIYPSWNENPGFTNPINTYPLSNSMSIAGVSGFPTTHMLSEYELIACGNLDTWKLFGLENPNSLSRTCMRLCNLPIATGVSKIRKFGSVHYIGESAVEAVKSLGEKTYEANVYEEICYPFFRNIYETYYGKYYMLTLGGRSSSTCFQDPTGYMARTGVFLGEGGSAVLADSPTSSGWPDNENSVLGLSQLGMFIDNSGKLSCFVSMPNQHSIGRGLYSSYLDIASFNGDFISDGQNLYTKCEVDGRAYNNGGRMGILLKMPSMITHKVNLPNTINNNGVRAISLCYGLPISSSGSGSGTQNNSYTNIFKENRAAGGFLRAAVPFKNNQITYGPWGGGSSIFVGGGVDLQVREDLNPWTYGGRQAMERAGSRLASDGLPYRTRYESGHITIAESPAQSLGSSNAGPMLASIVVKFDKSGSTTTYNYETYKPKFGNYAEHFNEYFKKNVSDRRDNYNAVRETYMEVIRAGNAAVRSIASFRQKLSHIEMQQGAGSSSASLGSVMISSYPEPYQNQDDGCKIETGTVSVYKSDVFQDKDNYMRYAAVGMDMLFSPVSMVSTSLMGYMSSSYAGGSFKMGPVQRMPPYLFNGEVQGGFHITNFVLNPYTTSSMLGSYFGGRGSSYGFQTDYITFDSSPSLMHDIDNQKQQQSDIRGIAHRGPLILHGWGYDTEGKPVPNQNPSSPNMQFASKWLSNPKTWPVGPVDLRWDNTRGVWVSPPSERLVVAQLLGNLPIGGSTQAVIITNLYNDTTADDGTPFNTNASYFGCEQLSQVNEGYPQITVYDAIARPAAIHSRVICYHVGYGRYIPLMIADSYRKGPDMGCCTAKKKQDINSPCYDQSESPCKDIGVIHQNEFGPVMVEGLDKNGNKYLYDLKNMLRMPGLESGGQMKVLGYTEVNSLGMPCMTGISITECSGDYPGDPNPGIDCPPGTVIRYPPDGPPYCAGL